MNELGSNLRGFRRRVRLARAWKGLAIGGSLGAVSAALLAMADYMRLQYFEWPILAAVVFLGMLIGIASGWFGRISDRDLADSIDRRADLKERLSTAVDGNNHVFADAQQADAKDHLTSLKPATVYPLRPSRWHYAWLSLSLLTALIFIMGNTAVLLSDQERKDREEMKKAAELVERVAKPLLEDKEKQTAEERELAQRLEQLKREMEKGRMPKQEAMQEANELMEKAEELSKKRAEQIDNSMRKAETALEKMAKSEQLKDVLKQSMESPGELSPAQKQALQQEQQEIEQQMQELQQQIDSLQEQMENASSEQAKAALQKQMDEAKQQMQQLQLSKEALETFQELMESQEWKELMEMAKKLKRASQDAKDGKPQQLTKEQIEEMQQRLEELAEQLKDPEFRKQYLEALKEALENAEKAGECQGACLGLMGMLGLPSGAPGKGGRSQDNFFSDSGFVPQDEKESTIESTMDPLSVTGQRRATGEQTFIEIKGPTGVGDRSSTPYYKVLPKYKKQAEEAIDRQKIPRQHQKRVKEYFKSLEGGR